MHKRTAWYPQGSVGYWINAASRHLVRLHEKRLKALGFGMGHLPILFALEDGEPKTQKELVALAEVEQGTMAEQLGRMERDGVVVKAPHPTDKRGSLVTLSPRSAKRLPAAKAALAANVELATKGLTKAEVDTLRALLTRVVANLREARDAEG